MTEDTVERAREEGRTGFGTIRMLMAGAESERFVSLAAGLATLADTEIHKACSGLEAEELLRKKQIDLVVIDQELRDMNGIELAKALARQHPFVNCIMVDTDPHDIFHEKTEGLGVLMQLPSPPEMADAKSIIKHLAAIRACS